jgi:hypothetical protein
MPASDPLQVQMNRRVKSELWRRANNAQSPNRLRASRSQPSFRSIGQSVREGIHLSVRGQRCVLLIGKVEHQVLMTNTVGAVSERTSRRAPLGRCAEAWVLQNVGA